MIELVVEPRVSKSWESFCREDPPFSIALDGYVIGPPAFSEDGPHANFDHHHGVDRHSTRSTCMQVFLAIVMGLFETFERDGRPWARVFVNDCDPDVCFAVFLLRHPDVASKLRIDQHMAPLLLAADLLDTTGGLYPLQPENPRLRGVAWTFEPYFDARFRGEIPHFGSLETRALIDEVGARIGAFAEGRGGEIDPRADYEGIGGGPGWRMIAERGPFARSLLSGKGVGAFVSARDNGDGTWTYSLGRTSPYVLFPLHELYRRLNEAEGLGPSSPGWGGSNTIGGSPRSGGSRLDPQTLERLVNEVLEGGAPA